MATHRIDEHGVIHLLLDPPDRAAANAAESLFGQVSSDRWLPRSLYEQIDLLADEHARRRGELLSELEALDALHERFAEEDAAHKVALVSAARDGGEAKDGRTSEEERERLRDAAEGRVWAAVGVFAEAIENAIATVRELEPALLADLKKRLKPAKAKREEAARLLAEARMDEFEIAQRGQWVMNTAEGGRAFGRQAAPVRTSPPPGFNDARLARSLEVPWWKRQDREMSQPAPKPVQRPAPASDQTGVLHNEDGSVMEIEAAEPDYMSEAVA